MDNNFKSLFELTDEQSVNNFEQRMEIILPLEYRKFLLKYNVSMPSLRCFKTERNIIESIEVFFGLTSKKHLDLIQNRVRGIVNDIPRVFLVIGEDGGGNKICIKLTDPENGSIWFFDHEEVGDKRASKISNSFTGFINMLH